MKLSHFGPRVSTNYEPGQRLISQVIDIPNKLANMRNLK